MALYNGKHYTKKELLEYLGNIGTIADVRCIEYQDGFAKGLRAYEVVNGEMRFTALIDKCMDIGEVFCNGQPFHFFAHPGIISGNWWYDGPNAIRSIMGGMMFTCGLGNVGPMQTLENGQQQPQHGFIRNSPVEQHGVKTYWIDDDYFIELTSLVRESCLFGTNLTLRRTITTKLGETKIKIEDQIENESSNNRVPLMLMYHYNVGFPLLDEDAEFVIDPVSTVGRDQISTIGLTEESFSSFGPPVPGYKEQVFYHKLNAIQNRCTASLINPNNKAALSIDYDQTELPNLIQWKCKDAGNYVMGIEPANCFPEGVHKEADNQSLRYLNAGEIIKTELILSIVTGAEVENLYKI